MTPLDLLINDFDKVLRIFGGVAAAARPSPSNGVAETALDAGEKQHSAGLMRVNHVGEVCAQALYEAQGRFSKNAALKQHFAEAGREEEDHLAWTAQRLRDFGSRPSLLNPFWYAGAYALGAVAARLGDGVSLGFVVETENQVTEHLESHLQALPPQDAKSRAIVAQMRDDEAAHAASATAMGASKLPPPVQLAMRAMAKVMTSTAYYL
ncbi:MAG: 2-polyprenyl-3-methyl-6-methoxy-1,4-benzoquinone monooxygenase [Burkholderiaceae bacterium]|nr:2-polyprenyl-3-methyl-6-methoxy-1,4-benzoquinone monooxygenase [Burkholderiaceae bacterium]